MVLRNSCEGSEATYAKGLRLAREQTEEASVRALLQATRKQLVHSEDNTKEIEREFKVPPSPPLPFSSLPSASSGLVCWVLVAAAGGVTDTSKAGVVWLVQDFKANVDEQVEHSLFMLNMMVQDLCLSLSDAADATSAAQSMSRHLQAVEQEKEHASSRLLDVQSQMRAVRAETQQQMVQWENFQRASLEELSQQHQKIQDVRQHKERLEEQLQVSEAHTSKLQQELTLAGKLLQQTKDALKDLEFAKVQVEKTSGLTVAEMQQELQDLKRQLHDKEMLVQSSNDELQMQIDALRDELASQQSNHDSLAASLTHAKTRGAELQTQVARLEQERTELQDKAIVLEARVDSLRAVTREQEAALLTANLEREAAVKLRRDDAAQHAAAVQQYKEERLREQQALHADADLLAQELQRVTCLVGDKEAEIEELKGKAESLRRISRELADAEGVMSDMQAQLHSYQTQVAERERQKRELVAQLEQAKTQLEQRVQENASMQTTIKELECTIQREQALLGEQQALQDEVDQVSPTRTPAPTTPLFSESENFLLICWPLSLSLSLSLFLSLSLSHFSACTHSSAFAAA
jgi:chromosome segregation ATPase